MNSQEINKTLVSLFSKIEGDDNTKYDTQVGALIGALYETVAHEPRLCTLLDEFRERMSDSTHALTIDRRVREQVGAVYEFDATDKTDGFEKVPSNYLEVLNIGLAHIGYAMQMARIADVSKDDQEYLTAKVTDALAGDYQGRYLSFQVPTKTQSEEALAVASLLPAVEMAQRVLNIEIPTVVHNRKQIEFLLETRRAALVRAQERIESFNPQAEQAFQNEVDAKLLIERKRMNEFKVDGTIDPTVTISALFNHYDDQLLLNIQTLERQQQQGSLERQCFERAQVEFDNLSVEIEKLEETLIPLADRAKAGVPADVIDSFEKTMAMGTQGIGNSDAGGARGRDFVDRVSGEDRS